MEEPRHKYILLQDRVGQTVEKNILTSLGLSTKSSPTQVLRGDLLEALSEPEQPQDSSKIALVGIDRKSLRLECGMEYLKRLSEEEANLLLAISSLEARYLTFTDRIRLDFGRKLKMESKVYVSVKGFSKTLPGVVWYKGELPSNTGTMFGVELINNPGQGTSDGTFRNKKYFACAPDSGVFVGLDKLTPRNGDDLDSKSPKKGESYPHIITSRIKETVKSSFLKGKNEPKSTQGSMNNRLEIDQRVVTYLAGEQPFRGKVRYIGEEKDRNGKIDTMVGLELDTMDGSGTGKWHGKQRFVCRTNFAVFVPIEGVIPEEDFDEVHVAVKASTRRASEKCTEAIQQQIHKDEILAKSLSCDNSTSDGGSAKRVRRASLVNSADHDVIMAAGESSQTDHTAFIQQQQKMLHEFNSSKVNSASKDNDVIMHDEERTDSATYKLNFEEEHVRNTPPNNPPVTKQPGLSGFNTTGMHSDFVNIELKEPHETGKHVRHPDVLMEGNIRTPLVTEVSDCSPGASNRTEDQVLSKEPFEHLSSQNAMLHVHTDDTGMDRTTDLEVQTTVDNAHGLEVGSMVEVPMAQGLPRYGVIRWIGSLPTVKDKLVAGLELEDEQSACSDGTFNGERYFTCPAGRGFFTLLKHCIQDSRFTPNSPISDTDFQSNKAFGSLPSPDVKGVTVPPQSLADDHCGTMRGIQGHHNSCYLDATLYSMFAFSSVFDTLLHRQRKDGDLPKYDDVQLVLRESIVNPLRVHGFVRADRILQLRELLDKLSSTAGLVNEEKDPEEFLNSLLQQVLKADPFLHLKSRDVRERESEGAFFYQIITEKDEAVKVPQVQQLLEQSFLSADIILSEVPSCLILQMPRFGSRYKMYDMILPNLKLDVTHIVENVPRECIMCGNEVAQFECKMCYQKGVFGDGHGIASYCHGCNAKVHSHRDRVDHKTRPFLLPRQWNSERRSLDQQKMDLFAVVCIETSHYVAFVKCGVGVDAPWCFFDSMADRKGEKNGYNIPAVTRCPEALEWLSKDPKEIIAAKERGDIPVKIRRLLGDGYLCMYQNLDMTMYK